MIHVRWTTAAADELSRIVAYIRKGKPEASRRVAKTIFEGRRASKFSNTGQNRLG
jgi:plasmid stabilization system protein ParE